MHLQLFSRVFHALLIFIDEVDLVFLPDLSGVGYQPIKLY